MSLTHILPPARDTNQLLREAVTELQRENDTLRAKISELNIKLTREEEASDSASEAVNKLRSALTPLYSALQQLFGDIEAAGFTAVPTSGIDPRKAVIWEDWKRKMPGIPSRFIDALMMHGELTQGQLRLHAKCAQGSVTGAVSQLWKAGLINKNGGKISLKEL